MIIDDSDQYMVGKDLVIVRDYQYSTSTQVRYAKSLCGGTKLAEAAFFVTSLLTAVVSYFLEQFLFTYKRTNNGPDYGVQPPPVKLPAKACNSYGSLEVKERSRVVMVIQGVPPMKSLSPFKT
jgi:hypothetical protein